MTKVKIGLSAAVFLVSAPGAATAHAQTIPSIDMRTWRPSADPEAGLVLEPAVTPGPWQWNVAVWGSYAQDPVVLRDAATGTALSRPLEHAVGVDLAAEIGLGTRAAISVDLPFFPWQEGAAPQPGDSVITGGAVQTTGLGDLALSGKVTIVSNDRQGLRAGLGLAAVATVTFPTGDRASFLGEGAATSSLRLLGEYAVGVGAVRATLGYKLRVDDRTWPDGASGSAFGDEIPWSAGVVLRPRVLGSAVDADDRQAWEVAFHGALPAGPVAPFGKGAALLSPALFAVDDRIALGNTREAFILWGADVGLNQAYGVPSVRAVMAVGWAPRVHDRDGDGVPDDVDQCPDLPEDRDGIQDSDGCPEDDADGDGIPDDVDACPIEAGEPSDDPKKNGCPRPPGARPSPPPPRPQP